MKLSSLPILQARSCVSHSLPEGTRILNREWSRHRVAMARGHALRLRFSTRSITPHLSVSTLAYGASATVVPQDRAEVLLLQMPRVGAGLVFNPSGITRMDARHDALIDVRRAAQAPPLLKRLGWAPVAVTANTVPYGAKPAAVSDCA